MVSKEKFVVIIFLFVIIVFSHRYVRAQRSTSIQGQQIYFNKFANNIDRLKKGESKNLLEGYYLCEDWKSGTIYAKPDVQIEDLQLKYCVLNQEFEFISDNDTFSINKPDLVDSIKYDNKCFVYSDYYDSNQMKSTYFELLSSVGYVLLQKYDCKFVRGKKQVSSFEEPTDDSYRITTQFYMKEKGSPAFLLPKSKQAFFNIFGDKKEKIRRYMKAKKLKRNNGKDLSKIIAYYYELN